MSERKPTSHWGTPKSDDEILTEAITKKLKSYYDDIAKQEIPDQFRELLNKLDATDKSKKSDQAKS